MKTTCSLADAVPEHRQAKPQDITISVDISYRAIYSESGGIPSTYKAGREMANEDNRQNISCNKHGRKCNIRNYEVPESDIKQSRTR